jgi:hypothetical protein
VVIETKLQRGSRKATIKQAREQTWQYIDQSNAQKGHLIVFDRSARPWSKKIFTLAVRYQGVVIQVWRM